MIEIITNYKKIISQIDSIKKDSNVNCSNAKLIAVSKTFPIEDIQILTDGGHKIFGENKVQEATQKWGLLKSRNQNIELHLIGPLQSNKVKQALKIFDVLQTIDREKIAIKISNALKDDLTQERKQFFIQVNIGNEIQKSGVETGVTGKFVEWCVNDLNLNVVGLMCIPPFDKDSTIFFKSMKKMCNDFGLKHLSMGMSSDYKTAIRHGATYVRVGTGIFGKRG